MIDLMYTDIIGSVVWFLLFIVFIFVYPRLMLSQMIYKLEASAKKLESMSESTVRMVSSRAMKGGKKNVLKDVRNFSDFFVVQPSGIDPYGLVQKIDLTSRNTEDRFSDFSESISGKLSKEEKQRIDYSLRAAVGVRQISKIVRHYVETAKKFKNLQIAMILQMQIPIIEKIAESQHHGAKAFLNSVPVGDSIGPLVAASYMKSSKVIAEDVVMSKSKVNGRNCIFLKATGPEPHLGRTDEALEKILKSSKISRIITIDASQKLEGEVQGSVAEGVGFAMGGFGQREIIENIIIKKKIPIDSIIIKVGIEDAIMPMKKAIFNSLKEVRSRVGNAIERAPKGSNVIVVGVGNSTGIRNDNKAVADAGEVVKKLNAIYNSTKK